ncbi:DNA cytosine methyltransferase [Vreelandella zhanjiangensis]|uniref:DNA cytosine methyltransferase n=1 Tax=Vreelandella zhanjiangensis TaxID=1121960 RepID=UPI00402A9051
MILSLFCGAGGLDSGFESEGFKVGLAFDIRKVSIQTYNHNREKASGYVRDVQTLTLEDLDDLYGEEFKPLGIIGGPPCQSFSVSNVNGVSDDPRHSLPFAYSDLLMKLNQRNPIHFFIFENVLGLKSKKHISKYNEFKNSFENAGFNIQELVINAKDLGVPQNRERIFFIGLNREIYPGFSFFFKKETLVKTVRDAIGDLPEPINFEQFKSGKSIDLHPNHWCMTPKSKKFSTPGMLQPGKAIGRSFRVLNWDRPSPTVAYGNREVHVHPNCHRRLSVFEASLLQGFSAGFEFKGTLSSQFLQISEAVPPPVAKEIAKSIKYFVSSK